MIAQKQTIDASEQLAEQRRSVSFDSYDITVKQLVAMVTGGEINIAPDYQRHFVWDDVRQSQLIESIFLGIPVPSLFMATNKDATWEVVDGLQRITTLLNFIQPEEIPSSINISDDPLSLKGLEKLTALNGETYQSLPDTLQLSLLTRPMRLTVLNDRSDFQVRFDLFERLNTGGIILHEQEIRGCVFLGPFNDFIKECASDERLRTLVKRRDTGGRGNLEELVLKFFAYLEHRDNFTHSVKDFLNEYMEKKTKKFGNRRELEKVFNSTLDYLSQNAPNGIVRSARPNTTPLVLFEAMAVGVGTAAIKSKALKPVDLQAVMDSTELTKATTGATNSRPKLEKRISIVENAVT